MVTGSNKANPAAQAPVSAHPLFPLIVAMWFAALLGIGTMILPQTLFDRASAGLGMESAGFGVRLFSGLLAGGLGAVAGVLLARKVASGHSGGARPRVRQPALAGQDETRRPISAKEELGSERLDEPVAWGPVPGEPATGRRRALMVNDENVPSDLLPSVPLPGGDDVLDLDDEPDFAELVEEETLELEQFEDRPRAAAPLAGPLGDAAPPAVETTWDSPSPSPAPRPQSHAGLGSAAGAASSFGLRGAAPFASPAAAGAPFAAPLPGAEAGHPRIETPAPVVCPPEPVAESIRDEEAACPSKWSATAGSAYQPLPFAAPVASAPEAAAATPPAAFAVPAPVAGPAAPGQADLASLDIVALVERFARSLRQAQSAGFAAPAAAETAQPGPAPLFPAVPSGEPAPFAAPACVATAPSLPAALTPLTFEEPDEDDHAADHFSLPLAGMPRPFDQAAAPSEATPGPIAAPEPAFASLPFSMPQPVGGEADQDEEGESDDEGFGSLLAMKAAFAPHREFVRIEDEEPQAEGPEPVVAFPQAAPAPTSAEPAPTAPVAPAPFAPAPFAAPQAAAGNPPMDRESTEAALRQALARLQQLSGAA